MSNAEQELGSLRKEYRKKCIMASININSVQNKFVEDAYMVMDDYIGIYRDTFMAVDASMDTYMV